jgi:hypothetical protein
MKNEINKIIKNVNWIIRKNLMESWVKSIVKNIIKILYVTACLGPVFFWFLITFVISHFLVKWW